MRIFYNKVIKNIIWIYLCFVLVFSYRMIYNEVYTEIHVSVGEKREVYPFGKIVGLYTECEGIFVIDTCEIEQEDGSYVNPTEGKVKKGDYILSVNGNKLDTKEELVNLIEEYDQNFGDGKMIFTIKRDDETLDISLAPVLSKNGSYKLGIWIKDDLAGVGTITFFTENGQFAALGHGMGDGETNDLLEVESGDVYISNIIGIKKGEAGSPGEVKGVIYYGEENHLGDVVDNTKNGIYGALDEEELLEYKEELPLVEIAYSQDIETGAAQIISEISGERKYYDIEITYVDYLAVNSNKGIHIKVVDEDLLELTGGIVQGMSGSPIIQNGKLIGAVTHVLINDPTSGYGIFIEEMLE